MSAIEYADLMVKTDAKLPELKQEFGEHITNEEMQSIYEPKMMENTESMSDYYMEWDFDNSDYGNETDISENWGAELEQSVDVCSADTKKSPSNEKVINGMKYMSRMQMIKYLEQYKPNKSILRDYLVMTLNIWTDI